MSWTPPALVAPHACAAARGANRPISEGDAYLTRGRRRRHAGTRTRTAELHGRQPATPYAPDGGTPCSVPVAECQIADAGGTPAPLRAIRTVHAAHGYSLAI